jgi:hypothetical protein
MGPVTGHQIGYRLSGRATLLFVALVIAGCGPKASGDLV